MVRLESMIATTRPRPRLVALAAGLVLLVVVGGSSGVNARLPIASPSPSHRASPSPVLPATWVAEKPNSTTVAEKANLGTISVASSSPSPAQPTSADIEPALASRASWVGYTSRTYRFVIEHPADWPASETETPGWAIFTGWDESDIAITWRAIPLETSLQAVTDEVRTAMYDSGFAVEDGASGLIAGLPARILVLDGKSPSGEERHGIVGVVVTATGRYRVELWSRPGTDAADMKLFDALTATFDTTDAEPYP